MSDLPPVTHLQFLILDALLDGDCAGREVREALADYGDRRSLPAFYELMARLEKGGLVEGEYAPKEVNGQPVRERRYRITEAGRAAHVDTCRFYREKVVSRIQEA